MSPTNPFSAVPAEPHVRFWLTPLDRTRFFGAEPLPPDAIVAPGTGEELARSNPAVVVTSWQTPPLPEEWLAAPECRLRYVCHAGGSVRRQVPRSFLERGGLVTNWGGAVAPAVAEHALLLALAALRDAGRWRDAIAGGRAPVTRSLFGKKVGIHGFGRIAQRLVRLLRPFGGEIRAYSGGVPASLFAESGVEDAPSLEVLFAESEVLFECEALTPETAGSVTEACLRLLPEDAVFVNVGRGAVVDEAVLERCARSGKLRVAVDVLAREPASPAAGLYHIPGVVISPHIGGPVLDDYPLIGRDALKNIERYLAGAPVENVVDLAQYDRST